MVSPGEPCEPAARGLSARRVARFARRHLGYIALAPLLLFAGTTMHELAHAGAAVALGGEVTAIELWPSFEAGGFRFGATYYRGSFGERAWVITMAPAVLWTAIAALSLLLLGRARGWPAKIMFLFCFVLPLADIGLQLGGLFQGRPGADYTKVLGDHRGLVAVIALTYFAAFFTLGWRRIFVPVFGRGALSPGEYAALLGAAVVVTPIGVLLGFR